MKCVGPTLTPKNIAQMEDRFFLRHFFAFCEHLALSRPPAACQRTLEECVDQRVVVAPLSSVIGIGLRAQPAVGHSTRVFEVGVNAK
jgi:hypothetical protein